MSALLPCPFSTDKPHDLMAMGDGKGSVWVECMECGAKGPLAKDRGTAFGNWNRRSPPSPWRPIESAPKDGTEILVYVDYGDGSWKIEKAHWQHVFNKFMNATYDPMMDDIDGATHWQPLPSPPSEGK